MSKLDLSEAEFLFKSDGLAGVSLHVFRFRGQETISQPFEFVIDLVCDDADLDIEAPIGQPACLSLRGRLYDGSRYERHVHGVIERFVELAAGIRHSRYQATLVPLLKPLAYTRNSRIFQQQTTADVTKKVLMDGQVPADALSTLLHGAYNPRDYCVQYQESDLAFAERLWEEEGIFYFFEHEKDKVKITLGDGNHAFDSLPKYADVKLRDRPHLFEEGFYEFRAETALRPGSTVMRDYKFKQPSLDMEATAQADKHQERKMYFFPGEYVDPALGKRLSKIRLEELQCQRNRYVGTGNVRAMLPGYKFTLSGHRRNDCNREYLVVSVSHSGSQPQALGEEGGAAPGAAVYENSIACIPADVPYRPPRLTARPSIPGVQTAIVVGPAGEEIHCDSHGRVKVHFPWDREGKKDDTSSCFIRVSQPWGGVAYGGMFLPRIGQEVLVQFIEGDPDRPVIVGRVYNGENPPPYGLPDKKTVSTFKTASSPGGGGSNELRFEDAAGSEEIYLHGQLDMNTVIERDRTQKFGRDTKDTVGRDRSRDVGNNETISIGVDRSAQVGSNEKLKVGSNQTLEVGANQDVKVGQNRTTHIGGNKTTQVSGSHTETVSGAQTITILQSLTETVAINYAESVGAAMELTIGGAFTETVGATKNSTIGGALSETIGASHRETIGANLGIEVGGAASVQAGKDIALQAGQGMAAKAGKDIALQAGQGITAKAAKALVLDAGTKLNIVAADEITLCTGSASIVLKKSGDIVIKGNKINIKGSGDVVIKGSKITQN